MSRRPIVDAPMFRRNSKKLAVQSAAWASVEALESRTLLSTVLAPTADTYVRDHNYALTNFGASPLLFAKNASSGDNRITFLKFDLTGVSSIGLATLSLTGKLQNSLSSPVDAGVFGVSDSTWVEGNGDIVNNNGDGFDTDNSPTGEMTWNNQPVFSSTPLSTATINRDSFQTYTFDVTSYLQAALTGGQTVVSLAVQDIQASSQFVQFLSKEATGPGSGPQLTISSTQTAPPSAQVSAPDLTTAGGTEVVSVLYSGGIDPNTIDIGDIQVAGTAGAIAVSGVSTVDNGDGSITANYTLAAPGGAWGAADNGTYTVSIPDGAVQALDGTDVPAASGSFRVNVGDTVPPAVSIAAGPVSTAGGSTYSFDVTYTDNVAVDSSTITIDNVSVSGPGGSLRVTGVTLVPSNNAASITATYTVTAPNGAWDASDDGSYLITVKGNEVLDTAGNPAQLTTGNFAVNIATPDTTPPGAQITFSPNVTSPGGTTETIQVVYSDDVAIDVTTIDTSDITVSAPGGGTLTVTGVTFAPQTNGSSITATYTVDAPHGAWDASSNGTYTINVNAGAVTDTSGNASIASSGTFNVSASVVDNTPPRASISAPSITAAGGTTQIVTVVYTDDVAVDSTSLNADDISVSGPNGPLTVTGVTFVPNANSTSITASYTVSAPNGAWDATANGTYSIDINSNQVRDTSGNAASVTPGSFTVNIALPNPTDASFNNGSAVTTGFVGEAVLSQPDGKIIVVGHQINGTQSQAVIERLNQNGTIDTTFGNKGMIVTPTSSDDAWYAVAVQGLNHFVVAGRHNGDFSLARFDFNGNLDPTFGSGGTTFTDFGASADTAYAVAVAADQTIVAAGASNQHFAVVRYDANGHLNTKFGAGGRQVFDTGGTVQALGAVTVTADGRIVAAGASDAKVDVVQMTATGDPDTTFNSVGMVVVSGLAARVDAATPDYTEGLAIQSDGKILVANQTTGGQFGIVRLKDDGSADTKFGSSGIATADFGGQDDADSIVVQSDTGNILVIGTSNQNGTPFTGVAAFDSTGKLISTFGNSGKVTLDSNLAPTSRELHIGDIFQHAFGAGTAEGKLVVGTSSAGATVTSSTLRRLIVPGSKATPAIQATFLGAFGIINGKKTKLVITDFDGSKITIVLTGGQGQAMQVGDKIRLEITANAGGCTLSITPKGGDGRGGFGDIVVTGSVKSLKAPKCDISGTLSISGAAGSLVLGNIAGNLTIAGGGLGSLVAGNLGGTLSVFGDTKSIKLGNVTGIIAVGGSIRSITAASLTGAKVLAGTKLGSDNAIGGSGSAADVFGAATIFSLKVTGAVAGSFIGAAVDPVDAIYGNSDDLEAAGATSLIRSISVKRGVDASTLFEAASFGSAKIPKKADPATDVHFKII